MLIYAQDSVILARVFRDSIDNIVFKDFIEELLPLCGTWPEPKSVLVMDNMSFHYSKRIEQICDKVEVKLVYLLPYSPKLNPIEEFLTELKAFIRRNWQNFEQVPEQGFDVFLEWCIGVVGARERSAKGHFRHIGVTVEEL